MNEKKFEISAKLLMLLAIITIIVFIVVSMYPSNWSWIEIAYWIAGIVVPIITLASIFLVLATLKVQQEQLVVQKEEIQNTKKELEQQNKTTNIQRFDNTFFLLVEKLNESYYKILQSEPKRFKNVIKLLEEKIEKAFESNTNDININDLDKRGYRAIYDGCLDTEKQYLALGLESIYRYFIQAIKLLIKSQTFIDDEKYYFEFVILELDTDVLNLILYMIIYLDEESVIKYLDDTDFVSRMSTILSPINLSKNRSIWTYISRNAGELDPYPLKKLIDQIETPNV